MILTYSNTKGGFSMQTQYDVAFIGGDLRQVYMANLLIEKGFRVIVYGLSSTLFLDSVNTASSLIDAISSSNVIIGPIPFSRDQVLIHSSEKLDDLSIELLLSNLTLNHRLIGGSFSGKFLDICASKRIVVYDLMKFQEVSILNSISTAEGTILEAIKNSTVNLHGSKCLILGYGKCAKILAKKLQGLDALVTISARKKEDRFLANAYGYHAISICDLKDELHSYEFIFNTIPALILDRFNLESVEKSTTIIDIASAPGGVDFEAANELGLTAKLCLGLPGKYAPKTSAEILVNVLIHLIVEQSD